ncbi:MAG: hypothetical protein MSA16_03570, partial [Treponema porcinum]|nr:hypothetical protein [Treponema porcinum]
NSHHNFQFFFCRKSSSRSSHKVSFLCIIHLISFAVLVQVAVRHYNVDVGIIEFNSKDKNGKTLKIQLECDFVANRGNEKIYIQSALDLASEKKKAQEENSLLRINDSFKKIIIQKEKIIPHYDDNGIYITCLEDFLTGDEI